MNPVSITTARKAPAIDRRERERRYFITMGVRTVCFLLALVTPSPWLWFFVAGAAILPYVAVVLANLGSSKVAQGIENPVGPAQLPGTQRED